MTRSPGTIQSDLATDTNTPVSPIAPTALRPANIADTRILGGFWGDLQKLNRDETLPHEIKWIHKFGAVGNFVAADEGNVAENRVGREFSDSDIYKVVEALTWENGRKPSDEFEEVIQRLATKALRIQKTDGYLSTNFDNPGQQPRYSDMEWGHELYCYGHLLQAAVARIRTGKSNEDPVIQLGISVANHVCSTFGPDGLQLIDGHPVIEPALIELYRATGDEKYLNQAQIFIDRRGHHSLKDIEFGRTYFQDQTPLREMGVLEGHAVRALYLAAGAVDLAIETEDTELLSLMERQYRNTLARRTYITGGMGSHHQDEAFGADFELPPDRAYCETCAGVASIMVAWRLLLATGDITWGDIIERTLYNILAASLSEDGKAFFYSNPLHQRTPVTSTDPEEWNPRASASQRSAWFEVSCCPPNLSRTIAQLGAYSATASANQIQLIQYFDSHIHMELESGPVVLRVRTDYPSSGVVGIDVLEAPGEEWTLALRIPSWASGASVVVDGKCTNCSPGAHEISGIHRGSQIELELPIGPRFVFPDPRIDAIRGCVAVERGPLVMCVESVFQPDHTDVEALTVDVTQPLKDQIDRAVASGSLLSTSMSLWPYADNRPHDQHDDSPNSPVVFTPYWSWGNHAGSTMRIWVPISPSVQNSRSSSA